MVRHVYYCVHRQQSEEGEKNGSEDVDEEKPGKRVMGPRKKFVWDDKLRSVSPRNIFNKLYTYMYMMYLSFQATIISLASVLMKVLNSVCVCVL